MPAELTSRGAVEAERREVLDALGTLAAAYHADARQRSAANPPTDATIGLPTPGATTAPQTPQAPSSPASAATPAATPTPQGPAAPASPPNLAAPSPAATPTPQGPAVPASPPAGPRTPAHGTQQQGAPALPPYPLPYAPQGPSVRAPRERGEVGTKTVQTMLLSLGGLLVAAAIIIFTAVAWRNLGNGGRAAILGGVTILLLAVPFAFKRFRLWATAETFAALAALALWCTTLAGYYLYRPEGASFGPETVAAWTAGVLAVLAAYRAAARLSATSWAMLPLAAVGASFAAAASIGKAVILMVTIAAALGAAAWITTRLPSRATRGDLWASRLLICASVVAACSAGLRAAFGLDDPVVPPIAAAVAVLAAANLLGVQYARRLGVTTTAMLVASSAAGSLVLCAWTLAARAAVPELSVPILALLAAGITALVLIGSRNPAWALTTATVAGLAGLAAFASVTFNAPDLTTYFIVFVIARLVSTVLAEPMRAAVRLASYVIGGGTTLIAALLTISGLTHLIDGADHNGPFNFEIPLVLVGAGIASVLLPKRFRFDAAALAATFAVISTSILVWEEDPTRYDALPTIGFLVCAVLGVVAALGSQTLGGRCGGWVAVAVWAPIAGLAASMSDTVAPGEGWIPFWLTVTAAAMLVTAVGAPRRSRPDRVLGAILAHVLAGITIAVNGLVDFFAWTLSDSTERLFVPAEFGIYTLALVGAAIMAPVRKWGYTIAAMATGTVGWWTLLAAEGATTLEYFTAPPAAMLFVIGLWRLEKRPQAGSWSALALPIIGGIGPSLLLALGDGDPVRRVGVGAAAIAVIVAGLGRRWQAPLVLGSIALAVITINELTLLWDLIPVWIPPAIGGVILLGAGATFERRRRDLARIRSGLKSMR